MMETALKNHMKERGIATNVVTLLTMVEVDRDDQAFKNPTKPIGVFFSEEEAHRLEEQGFTMAEDAGRGYRRVVPSPEPKVIHGIDEIKRLIEENSSSRLKAVLIDLRNNPGGLLSAAVESADLFLNHGIIVSTKSRSEGNQQFQALPGNDFQNIKVGILINHRSASAAEVFTAAMKEHQRAWVMGEKSYGKGVVQKLFPLPSGAALQMTVSHYYTPNGNMIEGQGIQPNQTYPLPPEMKDEVYLERVADLLLKRK